MKNETNMVRVQFDRDEIYESEGRNKGPKYKKGGVYEFDEAFAQRWIRRGSAHVVDDKTPPNDEFGIIGGMSIPDHPETATEGAKKKEPVGFSQKPDPLTHADVGLKKK